MAKQTACTHTQQQDANPPCSTPSMALPGGGARVAERRRAPTLCWGGREEKGSNGGGNRSAPRPARLRRAV
ncbi:MAG: hypothetical protein ACPIOQ_69710, partial [Promethearchaeia archaeon]